MRPRARLLGSALGALCVVAFAAPACGGDAEAGNRADGSETAGLDGPAAVELVAAIEGTPTDLAMTPDGSAVVVTEKSGLVFRFRVRPDGSWHADPEPILDRRGEITSAVEAGMLGVAFIDAGDRLLLSSISAGGSLDVHSYEYDPHAPLGPTPAALVATTEEPLAGHYGGDIEADPSGDDVYVSIGDAGEGLNSAPEEVAPGEPFGAVAKIDTSQTRGPGPLNLWEHVIADGLRNPWRLSYDAAQDDLWIADVGELSVEEIDVLRHPEEPGPGESPVDFGWPVFEGSTEFRDDLPVPGDPVPPVHERPHSEETCAIVGVGVYRGESIPALEGRYLFGDYCSTTLYALTRDAGDYSEVAVAELPQRLVSSGNSRTGEVLLLGADGGVFRLIPAGEEPVDSHPLATAPPVPEKVRAMCRSAAAYEQLVEVGKATDPHQVKVMMQQAMSDMRAAVPDLPGDLRASGEQVLAFLEEGERVLRSNGWDVDAPEVVALRNAITRGTGEWSDIGSAFAELQTVEVSCPDQGR